MLLDTQRRASVDWPWPLHCAWLWGGNDKEDGFWLDEEKSAPAETQRKSLLSVHWYTLTMWGIIIPKHSYNASPSVCCDCCGVKQTAATSKLCLMTRCWFATQHPHGLQTRALCIQMVVWLNRVSSVVTCMISKPGWGYSKTGSCSSMFIRPISSGSAPWLTRYTISWSRLVPEKKEPEDSRSFGSAGRETGGWWLCRYCRNFTEMGQSTRWMNFCKAGWGCVSANLFCMEQTLPS